MMYLFGASGHGLVIQDIIENMGLKVDCFIDDEPKTDNHGGVPVHKSNGTQFVTTDRMVVSIGINRNRKVVAERYDVVYYVCKHPSAYIAQNVVLGEGSVVMAGAILNSRVRIGRHVILNTGACIDHECLVGDYVHVAPNATLCGGVEIGEGAYIGAGSVIIQGKKVGKWSTVGAGSVILEDVPDGAVVVGNPARIIR
jgi:sugar O-acyltransferase (sialic acid O-acetyltransferase NeuD family)